MQYPSTFATVFLACAIATGHLGVSSAGPPERQTEFGSFIGDVLVEWLADATPDRRVRLLADFGYEDPDKNRWMVPKGWIVDGASIPRVLWTLVGSPFVGDYRRASVVHDYYCDIKSRRWRDVHRMFYYASLAGGVAKTQAKLMYAAVYAGGPRWERTSRLHCVREFREGELREYCSSIPELAVEPTRVIEESRLKEIHNWITETDPTIPEIEARADLTLR